MRTGNAFSLHAQLRFGENKPGHSGNESKTGFQRRRETMTNATKHLPELSLTPGHESEFITKKKEELKKHKEQIEDGFGAFLVIMGLIGATITGLTGRSMIHKVNQVFVNPEPVRYYQPSITNWTFTGIGLLMGLGLTGMSGLALTVHAAEGRKLRKELDDFHPFLIERVKPEAGSVSEKTVSLLKTRIHSKRAALGPMIASQYDLLDKNSPMREYYDTLFKEDPDSPLESFPSGPRLDAKLDKLFHYLTYQKLVDMPSTDEKVIREIPEEDYLKAYYSLLKVRDVIGDPFKLVEPSEIHPIKEQLTTDTRIREVIKEAEALVNDEVGVIQGLMELEQTVDDILDHVMEDTWPQLMGHLGNVPASKRILQELDNDIELVKQQKEKVQQAIAGSTDSPEQDMALFKETEMITSELIRFIESQGLSSGRLKELLSEQQEVAQRRLRQTFIAVENYKSSTETASFAELVRVRKSDNTSTRNSAQAAS